MERRASGASPSAPVALAFLSALAALASAEEHSRHLRSGAQTQIGEVKAHSPFIDDLEPVAPLDAVAAPGAVAAAGIPRQGGARRPALYVPPYLYPDAFPASARDICHCDAPKEEKLTQEEELWAAEVAKQLNLPLSQVMHPADFKGVAHCDCGAAEKADGRVFRYVKTQATNSSGFTVAGADPTFPHGSYWEPEVVDASGLMAPADQLRSEEPGRDGQLQTPENQLPDRICRHKHPSTRWTCPRTSRSMTRSPRRSQNTWTRWRAGVATVTIRPSPAPLTAAPATQCPSSWATHGVQPRCSPRPRATRWRSSLTPAWQRATCALPRPQAGCSLFRVCAPKPGLGAGAPRQCVAQDSDERLSWQGHIERHFQCPENTAGCKRVRQVVQGLYLRKEGKPCRAR